METEQEMLLTDEELDTIAMLDASLEAPYGYARAVIAAYEAKLREQQEPVAFYDGNKFYANEESAICGCADMTKLKPVFTHPAPIQEGYALVPVEITEDMHVAAVKEIQHCTGNDDFPRRVWAKMLAAARSE